jgi:hypothetical protein
VGTWRLVSETMPDISLVTRFSPDACVERLRPIVGSGKLYSAFFNEDVPVHAAYGTISHSGLVLRRNRMRVLGRDTLSNVSSAVLRVLFVKQPNGGTLIEGSVGAPLWVKVVDVSVILAASLEFLRESSIAVSEAWPYGFASVLEYAGPAVLDAALLPLGACACVALHWYIQRRDARALTRLITERLGAVPRQS